MKFLNIITQIYAIQTISDKMAAGKTPSQALMKQAGLEGVDTSHFERQAPGSELPESQSPDETVLSDERLPQSQKALIRDHEQTPSNFTNAELVPA